jgi:DNA-directed RNA polymerase specialized sigma24 family protein
MVFADEREPMLNPTRGAWFLDLDNTCDEVLLLLAREAGDQSAGAELTCRYWRKFKTDVPRWSAGSGLTSWDLEDAQQQAYFWIQEAIRGYDSKQLSLPRGSSFRTFLQRVFQLRLLDFARSLHRNKKRFSTAGHPDPDLLPKARRDASGQEEERHRQLGKALGLLDPATRALWTELCRGKRLCDLTEALGVSYRTLKRRWRKLRQELARVLRPACPLYQSGGE